jgi:hypothetical protein
LKKDIEINIQFEEIRLAIKSLANLNDPKPLVQIVQDILIEISNRDYKKFDEKYIKMLIIVYASLAKRYKIKSEREVNLNYPDILFLNSQSFFPKYQHLFEIKYIKKGEADTLKEVKEDAETQVRRYMQLPEIKGYNNLKFWVIIFTGNECTCCLEVE